MLLKIRHTTTYSYDAPVPYGLQQVRLTPKSGRGQRVLDGWSVTVESGRKEAQFEDQNRNLVHLVSLDPGTERTTIVSEGSVEMTEHHGIYGPHGGFMPLWLFHRTTARTRAGPACRKLMAAAGSDENALNRMHRLMEVIADGIAYETGASRVDWTAEDAAVAGHGVCQDHAHVMIACARAMGLPARYVSGYLMMNDRTEQEATHAWAEVHLPDLGWVGFDPSNRMSPDLRYVRVATGLDYAEAAPVRGTTFGGGGERLTVSLEVQQQ